MSVLSWRFGRDTLHERQLGGPGRAAHTQHALPLARLVELKVGHVVGGIAGVGVRGSLRQRRAGLAVFQIDDHLGVAYLLVGLGIAQPHDKRDLTDLGRFR